MGESHLFQIKGVEECVDKASGIILRDVVIPGIGEEGHLIPIGTFDMLYGVPHSRQRGGLSLLSHQERLFTQTLASVDQGYVAICSPMFCSQVAEIEADIR